MPVLSFRGKQNGRKATATPPQESSSSTSPLSSSERSGLFILHNCPPDQELAVDIVAVHGLGGHWLKTFTKDNKTWLKDFLPDQLQDTGVRSRIMSFGYDSNTAFTKAVTDINDVAGMLLDRLDGVRLSEAEKSRSVIFIAHSLGGIVVKKLIIYAHERPDHYPGLLQCVHGIVFLGTPHRGSDVAYWAASAARFLQVIQLGLRTNTEYIRALKRNSPAFANISAQFVDRAPSLVIRTFFETEKLGNQLIVDKDSATLGFPNEIAVGVAESNHRTICKFEDRNSQRYMPVWQAIRALALSASSQASGKLKQLETPMQTPMQLVSPYVPHLSRVNKAVFSIPFPRDKLFVDRPDIFDQIDNGFTDSRPVALYGLGGAGKSQIAIEYAYRFNDRHPNSYIFWIYAANPTRFSQAYLELARSLQLSGCEDPSVDVCRMVSRWLEEAVDVPWLLILDNADSDTDFLPPKAGLVNNISRTFTNLHRYIPRTSQASQRLLITSRNRSVGNYFTRGSDPVDIGPLSAIEAEQLLLSKTRQPEGARTPETKRLVELLGRNALAIAQAAAYITETKLGVQRYLAILEAGPQNIVDFLSSDLRDPRREPGYPNAIFLTWQVTFDYPRSNHARSAEILSGMAMLDAQGIPEDLMKIDDEKPVDFYRAIGVLDAYSMITKEVGGSLYAMHPLVQQSVHYFVEELGQSNFYRSEALRLLHHHFPKGEYKNRAKCELLLPHGEAVLRHEVYSDTAEKTMRGMLHYHLARFYQEIGKYDLAYSRAEQSYQTRTSTLGAEHRDTADSLGLLARILGSQGKYLEAEPMLRHQSDILQKVAAPDDFLVLQSKHDIGANLLRQARYQEAEVLLRELALLWEKLYGKDHARSLPVLNNLAVCFSQQQKHAESHKIYGQVLVLEQSIYGEEHPFILTTRANLAVSLGDQGNYVEMERSFREIVSLRGKVQGKEHPDTLDDLCNLAQSLAYLGRYDEAERIYLQTLNTQEKVLGKDHPLTLITVHNFGVLYSERRMWKESRELFDRSRVEHEKVFRA